MNIFKRKYNLAKDQKYRIKQIGTGGTFVVTPILICIILFYKNISFDIISKNQELTKQIEKEKVRSANITLEFTKHQNHQKILDLQSKYLIDNRYIKYDDIITEEQIENL